MDADSDVDADSELRLEFLVDHLAETMTDAWDVTGTIAELIETSVPDHRDDLVGAAEALRKAMFASLRMLADKGKVCMNRRVPPQSFLAFALVRRVSDRTEPIRICPALALGGRAFLALALVLRVGALMFPGFGFE